jgi:hypothetical protein
MGTRKKGLTDQRTTSGQDSKLFCKYSPVTVQHNNVSKRQVINLEKLLQASIIVITYAKLTKNTFAHN